MRSTAIQYVGIDVHQATLVCVVKDETGQTTMESKVATRREAIESFVRGLGGRVRIAFEEGSQAQWLYELLRPISEQVIVCDPRKIATKGNKDDQRDAERLCELLRLNALQAVFHDHSDQKLKELVRCYEALVDDSLRGDASDPRDLPVARDSGEGAVGVSPSATGGVARTDHRWRWTLSR